MDFSEISDDKLLEMYKNLNSKIRKDSWEKFTDYNIRDVALIYKLEDKLGLIQLVISMAYDAKINYTSVYSPVGMWDSIIYNHLLTKDIVIPPKKHSISSTFEGGFVMDPITGLHDWVVSFDAASLYPSIIQSWNISPETYLGVNSNINIVNLLERTSDTSGCKKDNYSLCANGAMFSNDKKGVLGELVDFYMEKRKVAKKQMLSKKVELESLDKTSPTYKSDLKSIEKDIATFNNIQQVTKIANNSLFGALGNAYFRYYNINIAAAITHTGQYAIKSVWHAADDGMNKMMKTNQKWVVLLDTDSVVGDTEVYYNKDKIKISDLYDKFNQFVYNDDFNKSYVKPCDSSTTSSFNTKNKSVEEKNIKYIMKHRVKKRMFKIKTDETEVIVTEDHSLIIYRNSRYINIKPSELIDGDKIVKL